MANGWFQDGDETSNALTVRSVPQIFDLGGSIAVVTGAAQGIGLAATRALVGAGASVVMFDRSEEDLARVVKELSHQGHSVTAVPGDVRSDSDVARLVDVIGGDRLQILINCAGIVVRGHALSIGPEEVDQAWDVNVRGLVRVTHALLPLMVDQGGGKIINMGSLGTLLGLELRSAYAASKGAVGQYSKSLAVDLAQHNICVNVIAPGYVRTPMTREWLTSDDERQARMLSRIPLGRFADSQDLEGLFVFLASPASNYITGQVIAIDGGWSAW